MDQDHPSVKRHKLGVISGVYVPVCLNILSILMFLRFGLILGQVGLLGIVGLLVISYLVDFVTTLSLSAVASNGEVKGGGAYYLISRSLGPEFGGSIGVLFYLSQVLNTALNVVGLIDCLRLNFGKTMPHGYWWGYLFETVALLVCTVLCLGGSGAFAKASNGLLVILLIAILSVPLSALFMRPFIDPVLGIEFTGLSMATLRSNLFPHMSGPEFKGLDTFRDLFGILFPATSGIFAGASMSGDLQNPSKSIPVGTLWAMLSTFVAYLLVILSMAASTTHESFLRNPNIIQDTNLSAPIIFAGECAVTFFSALMGLIAAAKLLQALGRDRLFPGLSAFGWGTKKGDEPIFAVLLTYALAQLALFANLNQIATLISMGYQMTFFVMNLACFLLKIGSAPNFRPAFKFFTWETAFLGSIVSAAAMFFIDETYAASAVCLLVLLFLLIHYLSPPKHWGDVSQNLIYHQVRKYLLRLKPEHIKFWRPQIILLINNPRRQTRLIQFCNSMKKGALYILGHVIVTDDFSTGVHEAKLQQSAWTKYISEFSRIKAFVQLTMSPSITWGVRNLILASGLGGMRPNIAVLGFYNLDELRASQPLIPVPETPLSPVTTTHVSSAKAHEASPRARRRRRGDSSARLLEGALPTDDIKIEEMMSATDYVTILEDLALRYRINVAVAKGFEALETPRRDGSNTKKFIDLWPIQMSAALEADGKNLLTTNFDTYTLILQLGYILRTVPAWNRAYRLRVMVFVEYESEVKEERGRVEALLEKLRINAEVYTFWLASGELKTYEAIVNGRCDDPSTDSLVDGVLKGHEWWEDLRRLRGKATPISGSRELESLANVVESTSGRPGAYNPHVGLGEIDNRRRPSMTLVGDLPKNATVSALARLGVSMAIHTQALPRKVFNLEGSDSENGNNSDSDSDSGEEDSLDGDLDDAVSAASDGELDNFEPARRPLLALQTRRSSHGDAILRQPTPRGAKAKASRLEHLDADAFYNYGTTSLAAPLVSTGDPEHHTDKPTKLSTGPPDDRATVSAPALSPVEPTRAREAALKEQDKSQSATNPQRPGLLRTTSTSVRFSSSLVPQTKITNPEGSGPVIMFAADGEAPSSTSRPAISRTNSGKQMQGRSSQDGPGPTVSFAEPEASSLQQKPPLLFEEAGDARIDIPNLMNSYKMDGQDGSEDGSDDGDSESELGRREAAELPLSFNDLPSRAQHLILNELMLRNSGETAVLFTTLPIPEEGTCSSEAASVQYLSDVEVLCQGLPPTLMILSNNMTVTVSL